MEYEIGCMVNEYGSSNLLTSLVFLAQRMGQSTKGSRHLPVTGDTIARLEVASSEEAFLEGRIQMLWIDESNLVLLSILAAGRAMVNWNNNTFMKGASFSQGITTRVRLG